jgi:hypothetical protein
LLVKHRSGQVGAITFQTLIRPRPELAEQAARSREEAEAKPPGFERERLFRLARQAEIGAQISEWLRSPGLQPPE